MLLSILSLLRKYLPTLSPSFPLTFSLTLVRSLRDGSAGTFVLGLSWLIGTTAQEIIASSIFLFIKHAYDVGDKVEIDGLQYIVLE